MRKKSCLVSLILLTAVLIMSFGAGCASTQDLSGYVISSRDEIGANYDPYELRTQYMEAEISSLEELAGKSTASVKARLTSIDEADNETGIYEFQVLEDFFGTADKVIHLHAAKSSFFEIGGVYYLFLDYWDSPYFPHRVYNLIHSQFLVREYLLDGEKVLFFRDDNLGESENSDLSARIKELAQSMAEKGTIPTIPEPLSLDEALDRAGLIMVVTVTSADPQNKYVAAAHFDLDEVLLGKAPSDTAHSAIPVSVDTQIGERFVVLYELDGGKTHIISNEYYVMPIDSEEAQTILARFS